MYKKAEFEVVEFEVEDIIVTSASSADQEIGVDDEVPDIQTGEK